MIFKNGVANPSRLGGCAKLLVSIIVLNRNKKLASALPQLWIFRHVAEVMLKSSYWTVWGTKLFRPGRDTGINQNLGRFLVLVHTFTTKVQCNSSTPLGVSWQYLASQPNACSSLLLPAETTARKRTVL